MDEPQTDAPEPATVVTPPLWREFRDDEPDAPVGLAAVYIDGVKRASQVPGQELTGDALEAQFAELATDDTHHVEIHFFRAKGHGRGLLGKVKYETGHAELEVEPAPEPAAEAAWQTWGADGTPAGNSEWLNRHAEPVSAASSLRGCAGCARLHDANAALTRRLIELAGTSTRSALETANHRIADARTAEDMRERAHARFLERQDALQARAQDAVMGQARETWRRGDADNSAAERMLALVMDRETGEKRGGVSALESMLQARMAEKMEAGIDDLFNGGGGAGAAAIIDKLAPVLGPILMAKVGKMDPATVAKIMQTMNQQPPPG